MITPRASDIDEAAECLAGVAHVTPVLTSRRLDERVGREVFLKCESFQRCGAFKFRGAYNALSRLDAPERARGVVTHSSGNHGQAVALAAKLLGIPATVVMPVTAAGVKRAATEAYGASVVTCAAEDRERTAAEIVSAQGRVLVHPYDDDRIIAGQGTAARELLSEVDGLDLLLVPVGGGGLISGTALAASARSASCRVVGVEPDQAADAGLSFRSGRVHTLERVPETIADGLRTRSIGERNLDVMRRYVADMVVVSEAAILEALEFLWQTVKIVVEPSAAVAMAPLLDGTFRTPGKRVGVILSGGNVDLPALLAALSQRTGSAAEGSGRA